MPKVLCTLPNASDNINGIKFSPTEGGMLSDEIDQETADNFASIDGYEIVGQPKAKAEGTAAPGGGTAPVAPVTEKPAKTPAAKKGKQEAAPAPAAAPVAPPPADTPPAGDAPQGDADAPPAGDSTDTTTTDPDAVF